jgi:dinuclear metal center YbgI/SA1388 family protein
MKILDAIDCLENWAPPALQESYDNSGLLVGQKNNILKGCLVSLDVTETVVEEAITKGCNLIVAHHPFVFSGIKSFTGKDWIQRTLLLAIKNDIAIYAIHTNLDHVLWGVNHKIGTLLGLQNLRILEQKENLLLQLTVFAPTSHAQVVLDAMCAAGAGQIGKYNDCGFSSNGIGQFRPGPSAQPNIGMIGMLEKVEEQKIEVIVPHWKLNTVLKAAKKTHCYEEMAHYIYPINNKSDDFGSGMLGEWPEEKSEEEALQLIKTVFGGMIRYTPRPHTSIRKVAFCGGSGSFLLKKAKDEGADLFLTADFKYHQFFDADGQITIADIGHFEIEQFTSQLIVDHLKEKFTTFAPQISTANTNPVGYH